MVKTKHFSVISVVSQKRTVVKTKHFSKISVVSQKSTVVKTKHFSVISVITIESTVVKTKHFSVISVVTQKSTPKWNGLRREANFSLGRRWKTVKKAERTSPKERREGKNFWYSKKWQKRPEPVKILNKQTKPPGSHGRMIYSPLKGANIG